MAVPNFKLDLTVQKVALSVIVQPTRRVRRHSVHKIKKLAASIADTGFFNPILVDENFGLISGGARASAAERLGMDAVPAIVLTGLSETQKRRLALADNKLTEQATWDPDTLAEELRELLAADPDGIELTGFDVPDIDALITPRPLSLDDEEGDVEEPPDVAVSQLGDRWLCGPHSIVCGDATGEEAYTKALAGEKADVVFTDPPYGIAIATEISQRGKRHHKNFVMGSGEMGDADLSQFFTQALAQLKASSRDGAVVYVCIDWRHLYDMLGATLGIFGKPLNVWVKTNAGLGLFYRSQNEFVIVLRNGDGAHTNNIKLGAKRRHRTNVWTYAGNTANTKARSEELASHPTVKPTAMIADALEDVSKPGDLVLDPFGGSGSTLIAAHATKRRAVLIELDPRYVDLILTRAQRATGHEVTLDGSGQTFEQVRTRRQGGAHVGPPKWP